MFTWEERPDSAALLGQHSRYYATARGYPSYEPFDSLIACLPDRVEYPFRRANG
jgi:hypothetical protein